MTPAPAGWSCQGWEPWAPAWSKLPRGTCVQMRSCFEKQVLQSTMSTALLLGWMANCVSSCLYSRLTGVFNCCVQTFLTREFCAPSKCAFLHGTASGGKAPFSQFKGSGGRILFLQWAASEVFLLHSLHFLNMHCCFQFLREEDKSCSTAASRLSDAPGRAWQGRTAAVARTALLWSQGEGERWESSHAVKGEAHAGKCTYPQSMTQLHVGKEGSIILPLLAHLHLKQLFLSLAWKAEVIWKGKSSGNSWIGNW